MGPDMNTFLGKLTHLTQEGCRSEWRQEGTGTSSTYVFLFSLYVLSYQCWLKVWLTDTHSSYWGKRQHWLILCCSQVDKKEWLKGEYGTKFWNLKKIKKVKWFGIGCKNWEAATPSIGPRDIQGMEKPHPTWEGCTRIKILKESKFSWIQRWSAYLEKR